MRKKVLYILIGLIYTLLALHIAATVFYFYWTLWWFDIVMHFLGGVFIGLSTFWVVFLSGYTTRVQRKKIPYLVLFSVFGIGVGWEVFEYALGAVEATGYIADTAIDLCMDICGGVASILWYRQLLPQRLEEWN